MKIFILTTMCLLAIAHAQQSAPTILAYTKHDDKLGFINPEGEEVIPIVFDDVRWFSEGYIAVNKGAVEVDYLREGGKWGFWSKAGKEIIPLKYEDAKIFTYGLAPVKLDGKYGYINPKDKVIIAFQYEDAKPFYEEKAAVKIDGKWGFIDLSGKLVIQAAFDEVEAFDQGVCVVYRRDGTYTFEEDGETYTESYGKHGMINRQGEWVLDAKYDRIQKFHEGLAIVEQDGKKGYVNTAGEIVIPIQYDGAKNFSEGLAAVANYMIPEKPRETEYAQQELDSLQEVISSLFEEKGEEAYLELLDHPAYKALLKSKVPLNPMGKLTYGYINRAGETIIDFQYDDAASFINGLAKVEFGEKPIISIEYKDKDGNPIPNELDALGIGDNLIDKDGKLWFKENKRSIYRADKDLWILSDFRGKGASRRDGMQIIPNQYLNLRYIGDGFFVGEAPNDRGQQLIRPDGEIITDPNFKGIAPAAPNRFKVHYITERIGRHRIETLTGIIDRTGQWILKPRYDFVSDFRQVD